MRRAVFLDRDGTIIEDRDYLSDPDEARLIPGAAEGLARLAADGFELILVTNQSGVGRGYFTLEQAWAVNDRVVEMLKQAGAVIRKSYMAPEAPGAPSYGRKPSPQFLFDARNEFGIELSGSYMVGDKWIDLQTGWNAGVRRALLVRTGYGAGVEREKKDQLSAAVVTDNAGAAAAWILEDGRMYLKERADR